MNYLIYFIRCHTNGKGFDSFIKNFSSKLIEKPVKPKLIHKMAFATNVIY